MKKENKNIENKCNCEKYESFKHSPRSEEQVKLIKSRLNKVLGQVNGISKMIDENRYCLDLLIQISACKKALESVSFMIFEDHIKTCVTEQIKNGDTEIVEDTINVFKKLI